MKFIYTPIPDISYAEEGQANPLRWCIVSKTEDGFKNESNWMRCKDFFNDYCVAYNGGKRFSIYGFNTNTVKVPEKGEEVCLAATHLTPQFPQNVVHFNHWLEEHGLPHIGVQFDTVSILEFPPVYFSNTHHVSLVTLIIRLLNTTHAFSSFEEVIGYKQFPGQDQYKWEQVVAFGKFFNIPEEMKKYTWYVTSTVNSEKTDSSVYSYSSFVHNNGCLSWINAMKAENATQTACA